MGGRDGPPPLLVECLPLIEDNVPICVVGAFRKVSGSFIVLLFAVFVNGNSGRSRGISGLQPLTEARLDRLKRGKAATFGGDQLVSLPHGTMRRRCPFSTPVKADPGPSLLLRLPLSVSLKVERGRSPAPVLGLKSRQISGNLFAVCDEDDVT